jgi:anthranilate/para-aminobenzoate synthase component I
MKVIADAKRYIFSGDIFQTVLSQRFSVTYSGDPFQVYGLCGTSIRHHICFISISGITR